MPLIDLDSRNKVTNALSFPRLKLEKDERARIVCLESQPTVEYVHTLRAPQIENGRVVTEKVKNNRTGEMEDRTKFDFIGRPLCLGTFEVVDEKGSDHANCPACAASEKFDAIARPDRRYATNIGRYVTKPNGFVVAEPFQLTIIAWTFADQIFNKLIEIQEEWGDIRKHDLNCGPCQQAQFQKFEIQIAATAEWMTTPERQQYVRQVFTENKCPDLVALIGRKAEKSFVAEDVQTCIRRHKAAFGSGSEPAVAPTQPPDFAQAAIDEINGAAQVASDMDLDALLSDDPPATTPKTAIETDAVPAESKDVAAEALASVKAAAAVPQSTPSGEVLDFDALLADL